MFLGIVSYAFAQNATGTIDGRVTDLSGGAIPGASVTTKNLLVDGSCFVTGGYQNPTMTIFSLSLRASEYMMEQMKARNL